MREIMIRFAPDGDNLSEIDDERNYYLSEAIELIEVIRERLMAENRQFVSKTVECWVDGEKLLTYRYDFSKAHQTMIDELKKALKNTRRIFSIEQYLKREKEILSDKSLYAFLIRLDQFMGKSTMKPFPLHLSIDKSLNLFDTVFSKVETGFFSNMEEIMKCINEAYAVVLAKVEEQFKDADFEQKKFKDRLATWLGNEANFSHFINYVVARYQSVPKSRIYAIYPKFNAYQKIEEKLFTDVTERVGFDEAFTVHLNMKDELLLTYDNLLFDGIAVESDDMIRSLIISPVINNFSSVIEGKMADVVGVFDDST